MYRRGISPVIATVIIVAVAVAISIAVVGWIMGLWGSIAGGTESLKIYPDSYLQWKKKGEDYVLNVSIHMANTGSAAAVIYKVEILGVGTCDGTGNELTLNPGDDKWVVITNDSDVRPSNTDWGWTLADSDIVTAQIAGAGITCTVDNAPTSGSYYLIKVYTKAGNVYQANVMAK